MTSTSNSEFKVNVKGFTLIELMVVMAIVGVLSSLVIPFTVEMVNKAQVKQEVQELSLHIKRIRGETFAKGKRVELVFDGNEMSVGDIVVTFEHLQFPSQQLMVSRMGLVSPATVDYLLADQVMQLNLGTANYREIN